MKLYTFELTLPDGSSRIAPVEAYTFMQAYDVVVAYYPNHLSIVGVEI